MIEILIPVIVSVLSILIGGFVNAFVSQRQSRMQFKRDAKQKDYNTFIDATAAIATSKPESSERETALSLLIGAKAKILLNSSPEVIRCLVAYSNHTVLSSEESHQDFSRLLVAMRNEIADEPCFDVYDQTMQVLFRNDP
jgi:hypothetical protein